MIIAWDKGMFWHSDCEKDEHKSSIMKEIATDETGGTIKCLCCGKIGHYPKGGVGKICVSEIADKLEKTLT